MPVGQQDVRAQLRPAQCPVWWRWGGVLLFADDVVLLASMDRDLWSLERHAAEEQLFPLQGLSRDKGDPFHQGKRGEQLSRVEEFRCLGVRKWGQRDRAVVHQLVRQLSHLWSRALSSDQKNEKVNTHGHNEASSQHSSSRSSATIRCSRGSLSAW